MTCFELRNKWKKTSAIFLTGNEMYLWMQLKNRGKENQDMAMNGHMEIEWKMGKIASWIKSNIEWVHKAVDIKYLRNRKETKEGSCRVDVCLWPIIVRIVQVWSSDYCRKPSNRPISPKCWTISCWRTFTSSLEERNSVHTWPFSRHENATESHPPGSSGSGSNFCSWSSIVCRQHLRMWAAGSCAKCNVTWPVAADLKLTKWRCVWLDTAFAWNKRRMM